MLGPRETRVECRFFRLSRFLVYYGDNRVISGRFISGTYFHLGNLYGEINLMDNFWRSRVNQLKVEQG